MCQGNGNAHAPTTALPRKYILPQGRFYVSAARVALMNMKVIHSHDSVLKKTIQVRVIMIFKFFFKDKNTKIILLTLTRNSTDSLLYISIALSVWKEKGGRMERQAWRKRGSLKCAL